MLALVRNQASMVTKDELRRKVWPDTFVQIGVAHVNTRDCLVQPEPCDPSEHRPSSSRPSDTLYAVEELLSDGDFVYWTVKFDPEVLSGDSVRSRFLSQGSTLQLRRYLRFNFEDLSALALVFRCRCGAPSRSSAMPPYRSHFALATAGYATCESQFLAGV